MFQSGDWILFGPNAISENPDRCQPMVQPRRRFDVTCGWDLLADSLLITKSNGAQSYSNDGMWTTYRIWEVGLRCEAPFDIFRVVDWYRLSRPSANLSWYVMSYAYVAHPEICGHPSFLARSLDISDAPKLVLAIERAPTVAGMCARNGTSI